MPRLPGRLGHSAYDAHTGWTVRRTFIGCSAADRRGARLTAGAAANQRRSGCTRRLDRSGTPLSRPHEAARRSKPMTRLK